MADEDGWGGGRRHDEAGLGRLLNEIKSLRRDVAELQRGAALRGAGIRVSPEGMTVNSSLAVQGSLDASGNATFTGDTEIGGDLDVTGRADLSGDTTIGGNAAITGTLSLPNGIIDNDALANPIVQQSEQGVAESFGITTSPVQRATYQIPVPTGFTNAHMIVSATAAIHNTGSVDTYGYLRVWATSPNWAASSARSNIALPVNHTRTLTATLVRSHNDRQFVDGDAMTFYVEMYGDHTLSASPSTWVQIEALLTFTR